MNIIIITGDDNAYLKEVGYVHVPMGGIEFAENISQESLWVGGIPSDGSPVTKENYPIIIICVISYLLAGFNVIMAVVCILFTIIFRKKR